MAVLGWVFGGIEAEAAIVLGQPISIADSRS